MDEQTGMDEQTRSEIAAHLEEEAALGAEDLTEDVTKDVDTLWADFHAVVNMTSRQLRDWLADSGDMQGDSPALGYQVADVLGKRRTDLTDADVRTMRTVVDLVAAEHTDPEAPVRDDVLRRRLMAVGHDPLRS